MKENRLRGKEQTVETKTINKNKSTTMSFRPFAKNLYHSKAVTWGLRGKNLGSNTFD